MVDIKVMDADVIIQMSGLDGIWAMRKEIRIPRASIGKVYTKPKDLKSPLWRMPGTHVPMVIKAGIYKGKGRKEFWFTRFKSEAVVFDLNGEEFDRVVVDVKNAGEIVDSVAV